MNQASAHTYYCPGQVILGETAAPCKHRTTTSSLQCSQSGRPGNGKPVAEVATKHGPHIALTALERNVFRTLRLKRDGRHKDEFVLAVCFTAFRFNRPMSATGRQRPFDRPLMPDVFGRDWPAFRTVRRQ